MSDWCKHIQRLTHILGDRKPHWWLIPSRGGDDIIVPQSWKICPICQAERPTRENIRAAKMRALLDAGDDE